MSANTYGRQVVIPLTNKSGGAVAAGDVVVVDTANNDSFTTTTTAGFTGGVGIAQEAIASNAIGRVLVSGYAPLVNVSASVTRGHFGATHTVAKQAASSGASRGAGTFCQFLTGGTTPDAIMYPVDLLGSSLTNPMTGVGDLIRGGASGVPTRLAPSAAGKLFTDGGAGVTPAWGQGPLTTDGDLLLGATAGTPTRLAKGAAGGVLAMSNGAVIWNAGTSFPGSPATNDRYFRTDLGIEFFYDGTRWLSTQMFRDYGASDALGAGQSANQTVLGMPLWHTDFDLYVEKLYGYVYVATTNTGSHYWTFTLKRTSPPGTDNTLGSFDTSAGSADGYNSYASSAINTVVSKSATNSRLHVDTAKTGTPGNYWYGMQVRYRLVGA